MNETKLQINGKQLLEAVQASPGRIPAVLFRITGSESSYADTETLFYSWYEIGQHLRDSIAPRAPKGGGYDKTNVVITFADGWEYEARLDIKHTTEVDNETDLAKRIYDHLRFHSGGYGPESFGPDGQFSHLTYQQYANYIGRDPEGIAKVLEVLDKYLIPETDFSPEAGLPEGVTRPVLVHCSDCGQEYEPQDPRPQPPRCGRCQKTHDQAQARKRAQEKARQEKEADELYPVLQAGRTEVTKKIRQLLKKRSGKAWSCKGGRGTGWGWLTISAPPSRLNEYGYLSPEDARELSDLLGLDRLVHHQGVSVESGDWWHYLKAARGDFEPTWEDNYYIHPEHDIHIINSLIREGPKTVEELFGTYDNFKYPSLDAWRIEQHLYILEKRGEVGQVEDGKWQVTNE